jgi:hypothetical protein
MPSRVLREGILTSSAVNSLSPQGEVFYRRLMSVVDDWGLYDGRLGVIRAACYSLQLDRIREADISRLIAECEKAGLIVLYKVHDKPYLWMPRTHNQRRSKPKFPTSVSIRDQLRADVNRRNECVFECEDECATPQPPAERGGRSRGGGRGGAKNSHRPTARDSELQEAAESAAAKVKREQEVLQ